MRVARRLTIGGIAAAVCLAVAAPAAQAWVRTAEAAGDPQTTWVVTQSTITIRSTDPVLLQFVRGSQVRFGCDERGAKAAHHRLPLVYWGRTASSITAHVAGLVGSALTVCEAADVGGAPGFPLATGNFSRAPFDSAWRRRLAGTPAPGPLLAHYQLGGYWLIVGGVVGNRDTNRYGQLVRLPPAPTLVREFNRHFSGSKIQAGVLYAPTLAGVVVPHVAYVIGQGTGAERLEMAVIGFDDRRYVMHARLGMHGPPMVRPAIARADRVLTATAANDPQTTYTVGHETVTISTTDSVLLSFVRNSEVEVFCYPPAINGLRWTGIGHWGPQASSVVLRSTRKVTHDPPQPLPKHFDQCLAARVAGGATGFAASLTVFSEAGFTAASRRSLAGTPRPGLFPANDQLTEEWQALARDLPVRFLNLFGYLGRLPSAQKLVALANRRLAPGHAGMRYAATLAGVTVSHVVYVIGQGSSRHRLVMAVVGFDGKLYVMHAQTGTNAPVPVVEQA